jgi:hypothetical protein
VDARVDQFDLATLAASLLLPEDESSPLPSARDLQRRLILDKLVMVIVYQTVIPIPIPLFYDELGIEYLGIEGTGVQAHIRFPMPTFNLGEAGQLLSQFKRFFTDRNYLLDLNEAPEDFNLRFSLHDNYIQLAEYLGGNVLGSRGAVLTIDTYQNLARLMNSLKTLSLNDLIQAIPLEYRVGSAGFAFTFLTMDVDWLITTPEEFRQGAYQRLSLPAEQREDFLTVLPAVTPASPDAAGATDEQGLVVFLRGEAAIPNVATLEAVFGLAATGTLGFNTGFRLAGKIANFIAMELAGHLVINAPSRTQALPESSTTVSQTDTISSGLRFDGRDDRVQIKHHVSLDLENNFTIEAWVHPNTVSTRQRIFSKVSSTGYSFGLDGREMIFTTRLRQDYITNRAQLSAGQWSHVAIVFDRNNAAHFYVNGQLVQTIPGGLPAARGDAAAYLGTFSGTSEFWHGQLADIRVWNRARSAQEIQADMRRRFRGNESGLVGYWLLDEGTGNIAYDQTVQANHGALQGAQWVQPKPPVSSQNAFQLAGHSYLTILGHQVFHGDLQIVANGFWLKGTLDLFPETSPLQAGGELEGWLRAGEFYLAGNVTTALAGLSLLSARGIIANDRVLIEGTWLGQTVTLSAAIEKGALAFNGRVSLGMNIRLDLGVINRIVPGLPGSRLADSARIDAGVQATLQIKVSNAGFSAQVDAGFHFNGRQHTVRFTINVPPVSVSQLADLIRARFLENTTSLFTQLFANGEEWLRGITDGIIQFSAGAFENIAMVGRHFYRLSATQVAQVGRRFTSVADEAAMGLRRAGYAVTEVASGLRGHFVTTADQAARTLQNVGYTVNVVASGLRGQFVNSANEAARVLHNAGYSLNEVASGIRGTFTNSVEEATAALIQITRNGYQLSEALYGTFTTNPEVIARGLRSVGFTPEATAEILQNAFGRSRQEVERILRNVGYTASQAANAVKDFFEDAGNAIVDFGRGLFG